MCLGIWPAPVSRFQKVPVGIVEVDARPCFAYLDTTVGQSSFGGEHLVFGRIERQMGVVFLPGTIGCRVRSVGEVDPSTVADVEPEVLRRLDGPIRVVATSAAAGTVFYLVVLAVTTGQFVLVP